LPITRKEQRQKQESADKLLLAALSWLEARFVPNLDSTTAFVTEPPSLL
jgi:hypothetical protein